MSAPDVRGAAGPLQLGKRLAKGGEGAVYEVLARPETLAKIYLAPASVERADKLSVMQRLRTKELEQLTAWPIEVLRQLDGKVCGFLMPNLRGSKDIHRLYSPKSRLSEFPTADWRMLVRAALNTARAFALLHDSGYLVGDVNHGGVLVAPDATVRLIDCDSFQISHQGKTFLCEVGVQDFTPPELHGKAFKNTLRTANHDNFGLAVLIFQLLLNGRHPFAGRYSGAGDMPIEKAIPQFRYAYARDAASKQMQPPPYSAPAAAASPTVADLWERAFGQQGVAPNGRPVAKDWVRALTELEKKFTKCATNAAHFYFSGLSSCPWCPIERAGVALFGVRVDLPDKLAGGPFNLTAVWRDIESMSLPALGAMPTAAKPAPSAYALSARKRREKWWGTGILIGLSIFLLGVVYQASYFLLWGALAWAMGKWIIGRGTVDSRPLFEARARAKARYDDLTARRTRDEGAAQFQAKLSELRSARDEWQQLGQTRQREYNSLVANRQKTQLHAFLDRHQIERAKIPGVGAAKKTMLASFNIETAADISYNAVMQVPGFGPALTQRLLGWKQTIQAKFHFDPTKAVDPKLVADLDRRMAIKRADIENVLLNGRRDLIGLRATVLARRQSVESALKEAVASYVQAEADVSGVA